MTREEKELALYCLKASSDYHSEVCEECIKYPNCDHTGQDDVTENIIKALEQEPCEDAISRQVISDYVESHIQEINTGYGDLNKHTNEILRIIVDYIESMPPVTPQPFINKPCVAQGSCEHDKNEVLDKIRAEIALNAYPIVHGVNNHELGMTLYGILQVIDKYKAESEET